METSSINIIIGGAIGVVGVLLGAIINGIANYKNAQIQAKREQSKLHLAKLEEVFELLMDYSKSVYWFNAKVHEYSKSEITSEKLNEITEIITGRVNKTTTMVHFYAPTLIEQLLEINSMLIDSQKIGIAIIEKRSDDFEFLQQNRILISESMGLLLNEVRKLSSEQTGIVVKSE